MLVSYRKVPMTGWHAYQPLTTGPPVVHKRGGGTMTISDIIMIIMGLVELLISLCSLIIAVLTFLKDNKHK
jgi:hypothetical protein